MQRLLGFLVSLAAGILTTAAGMLMSAQALTAIGIALIGSAVAVWGWHWGSGSEKHSKLSTHLQSSPAEPRPPASPADKVVAELHAALDLTKRAGFFTSATKATKMLDILQAANVSASKQFDIPILSFSGEGMPGQFVQFYREYIESFLPFVAAGHIAEGKQRAQQFMRNIGE